MQGGQLNPKSEDITGRHGNFAIHILFSIIFHVINVFSYYEKDKA
jgi:hypothetical protein